MLNYDIYFLFWFFDNMYFLIFFILINQWLNSLIDLLVDFFY